MNKIQYRLYRLFRWLHMKIFGCKPGGFIQNFDHVHVGKEVLFSHGTQVYVQNHNLCDTGKMADVEDVYIGDYSWIGANAVILPGVVLGPHTIVGAGAVVTKSFPEGYCVLAGVPAKVVKQIVC